MTKRAVIYTRVSLDRTGEQASVQRQEQACRALATAREWEVVGVRTDNSVSATSGEERPEWRAVLDMIDAGEVDVVIAWHMDRITRTMLELEELITLAVDKGVGVTTATGDIDLTTDVGRMVARILAAVARAEVERKAARQRLGNSQRAAAGCPVLRGVRLMGWERDGVTQRPDEAEAIREAVEEVLRGVPLAEIARRWTEMDLRSGWGRSGWSPWGVRGVLLNPRQAGLREYDGKIVARGEWQPIITEERREELRQLLDAPERRLGPGGRPQTLLGGLAVCAGCEQAITSKVRRGLPQYACRRGCLARKRAEIDVYVESVALRRLEAHQGDPLVPSGDTDDARALRDELLELRQRMDRLAAAYADGAIDESQLRAGTERLRAAEGALERRMGTSDRHRVLRAVADGDVREAWAGLTLMQRRDVIDAIMDVRLRPLGRGAKGFRPELVEVTWK